MRNNRSKRDNRIVHNQTDAFGFGIIDINQALDLVSPVFCGTSVCDFNMPPTFKRGKKHEQGTDTITLIFVIKASTSIRCQEH